MAAGCSRNWAQCVDRMRLDPVTDGGLAERVRLHADDIDTIEEIAGMRLAFHGYPRPVGEQLHEGAAVAG